MTNGSTLTEEVAPPAAPRPVNEEVERIGCLPAQNVVNTKTQNTGKQHRQWKPIWYQNLEDKLSHKVTDNEWITSGLY